MAIRFTVPTGTPTTRLVVQAVGQTLADSRSEVADLRAELAKVRQRLALVSAHDAEVTAACRAGLAAARDGELDPWSYPRGVLEEYGQLPREGQHASELLAQGWIGGAE